MKIVLEPEEWSVFASSLEDITTRKDEINDGGIPREFVVKEVLRGISEEHVSSLLIRRNAYFLANSS